MKAVLPLPSDLPPVQFVGRGKLGQAVADAWRHAGGTVGDVVGRDGAWVLADDLPQELRDGGVEPGWSLTAVDDLTFDDPLAVQRTIAQGPARDVRLRFLIPGARRM